MAEARVWATSGNGKIKYVSLTADRLEEAKEVLREAFFTKENVCLAVGLAEVPEAIEECYEMVINTANQGVSLVAIDTETQKIVAVIINKIQHKNTPSRKFYQAYHQKAKYPATKGIFEFLIDAEDSVDPFTPNDADCLFELLFLAVLPDYSRRGIGYKMCELSIQLAQLLYKGENVKTPLDNTELPLEPRPQVVTVLFTTFKSQKIGRKLNMDLMKKISCDDLAFNGKTYASVLGKETEYFTVECKRLG